VVTNITTCTKNRLNEASLNTSWLMPLTIFSDDKFALHVTMLVNAWPRYLAACDTSRSKHFSGRRTDKYLCTTLFSVRMVRAQCKEVQWFNSRPLPAT